MAISGAGTQASPYLVASLADLQEFYNTIKSRSAGTYYGRCTANIDCDWNNNIPTMSTAEGKIAILDLDNHIIRKCMCSYTLFDFANITDSIQNGSLLDLNENFLGESPMLNGGLYTNVSLSSYVHEAESPVITNAYFQKVALDMYVADSSTEQLITLHDAFYSDIKVDIAECSGLNYILNNVTSGEKIRYCLLHGGITTINSGTQYPGVSSAAVANTLIRYTLPAYNGSGSLSAVDVYPNSSNNSLVDVSLIDDDYTSKESTPQHYHTPTSNSCARGKPGDYTLVGFVPLSYVYRVNDAGFACYNLYSTD